MKFKVGDKVKVKGCDGAICTVHEAGCSLAGRNGYKLFMDGFVFPSIWFDDELELLEAKPFTKSDLKDGMVVEINGENAVLIGDRFLFKLGWMPLSDYGDDMRLAKNRVNENYDITKCYVKNDDCCVSIAALLYTDNLTLIWKRKEEPEHKEMTVEEIEAKLGYKIKVVADN